MTTRYVLHDSIGSGGMATVHIGKLHAPLGFTRVVAIKRLHPALSHQPEFAAMLVDEARITARVRHLNVIPTLDVFLENGECFLVMEYVEGESLAKLLRAASQTQSPVPLPVVSAVLGGVLHGLHAAHVATSGSGEPLNIIHRDVSPQNILVGGDGIGRVFDFGVAKALGRLQQTRAGEFKGKLPYLAPEQFGEGAPDRRVDVYAASVTLWEALTTRRLFDGGSEEEVFGKILQGRVPAPSELRADVPPALDALVLRGLSRDPSERFASAEEMALALERAAAPATPREVSVWLQSLAGDALARRAALVTEMDGGRAAPAAPAPAAAPPLAAVPAPAAPTAIVASNQPNPTVTQRITVPLQAKARVARAPHAPSPVDSATPPHAPLLDDSATPPPLSLPVAEPGGRRRLVVRASLGALLLLCSLVAPAFGWMAFTGRQAAPRTVAAAATPPVLAAPREDSPKRTPPAEPARRLAMPLPIEAATPPLASAAEAKPVPLSSAKAPAPAVSAAAAAKPPQSRTFLKAKPASSSPDYWSSRAFSQRR